MIKKLVSIIMLVILIAAPVTQITFAQDTGTDGAPPDGGTDDPLFNQTVTGNTTTTVNGTVIGTVPLDGNQTEPVVEDTNVTEIDPIIYEMVKNDAEARYAELYALIFGAPLVVDEPDTPPEIPPTNATSPLGEIDENATIPDGNATIPDGNVTIPDGTVDGNATAVAGLELNGTEVFVEIPEGYAGPMIPEGTDPAIMNQFVHAWSAMESAESKTNPRAAANQYLRAMKQLSNAYRKFQKDNPVAAVGDVNDTGIPLDEVPVEPTDEEISETQQLLVGRFQETFQERITQMLENYNDVQDSLSPEDAVKALSALTKAEEKLLRIQTKIETGAFDEVMDDLDNATDTLDEDFSAMDDDASKQMFKTMNQLEAKISKMAERSARKAAKGEDTSEEDDLIAQLRGNKDHTKNEFKDTGKPDKDTGKPDKDTGKPDKDTGKPDKDTGKPDKDDDD